jgi:hypothetical protein
VSVHGKLNGRQTCPLVLKWAEDKACYGSLKKGPGLRLVQIASQSEHHAALGMVVRPDKVLLEAPSMTSVNSKIS